MAVTAVKGLITIVKNSLKYVGSTAQSRSGVVAAPPVCSVLDNDEGCSNTTTKQLKILSFACVDS